MIPLRREVFYKALLSLPCNAMLRLFGALCSALPQRSSDKSLVSLGGYGFQGHLYSQGCGDGGNLFSQPGKPQAHYGEEHERYSSSSNSAATAAGLASVGFTEREGAIHAAASQKGLWEVETASQRSAEQLVEGLLAALRALGMFVATAESPAGKSQHLGASHSQSGALAGTILAAPVSFQQAPALVGFAFR